MCYSNYKGTLSNYWNLFLLECFHFKTVPLHFLTQLFWLKYTLKGLTRAVNSLLNSVSMFSFVNWMYVLFKSCKLCFLLNSESVRYFLNFTSFKIFIASNWIWSYLVNYVLYKFTPFHAAIFIYVYFLKQSNSGIHPEWLFLV